MTKKQKGTEHVDGDNVRVAWWLLVLSLLVPVGAAQTTVGHVTIDMLPTQLKLVPNTPAVVDLWVNMTIECETGTSPNRFPTIYAAHPKDVHPPWQIEPESFDATGPFEMSAWTAPGTYDYTDHRSINVSVTDPTAASGWGNLTWEVTSQFTGVMVPPACSGSGYSWVLDRARSLLIEYQGNETAAPVTDGNASAPPGEPAARPPASRFFGESRTPQDAFAALAVGTLAVVVFMGLAGRMRGRR